MTVHDAGGTEVTITADDGSFDVSLPPRALLAFDAPSAPGEYAFSSAHDASFEDVLVVE